MTFKDKYQYDFRASGNLDFPGSDPENSFYIPSSPSFPTGFTSS